MKRELEELRKELEERTALSKDVGCFLMKGSEEAEAIVEVMQGKPGIRIEEQVSSYIVRGERVEIPLPELAEKLGREVSFYDIQVVMPAFIGGKVIIYDDKFCIVGDIDELLKEQGYI